MKLLTAAIMMCFVAHWGISQITVDPTATANFCVNNVLLGAGVTASNITYTGNAAQIGTFDATGTSFPINSGVILSSGAITAAVGPNNQSGATGTIPAGPGDPDLSSYVGVTNDAAVLEFDFVPVGDTVKFRYVFASEEYPEFLSFADVFGFFLSGPGITGPFSSPAGFPNGSINIAELPNGGGVVSVGNVNNGSNNTGPCQNCQYYVANGTGTTPGVNVDIQFDGHTVVLTAISAVQCGQTYHIKIAIADNSDNILDSGVFLEANSFGSDAVQVNVATVTGDTTIVEGCDDAIFTFTRPNSDSAQFFSYDVQGTATNGTDYDTLTGVLFFPVGQDSIVLTISTNEDDFIPGGNEPAESIILMVYTVSPCGDTLVDTGYVWIIEEPLMYTNTTADTVITCATDSIPLSTNPDGGIPGYNYLWSTNDTTNTIWVPTNVNGNYQYTVEIQDSCGLLTIYDTVDVVVNVAPPLDVDLGNDTTISCDGPLGLSASATGGNPNYLYVWNGGAPSTNSSTTVNVVGTSSYVVEVIDQCFNSAFDTILVTVSPNPPVVTTSNDTTIECSGDEAYMWVNATGGSAPYAYNWTSTGSNTTADTVNATTTTTYYVEVTDACTSTPIVDSVVVTVTTYTPLTVSLPDQTPTCPGDDVLLNPSTSGGNAPYDFLWSTGETTSSITVAPTSNASYNITITDQCGETANTTINVIMPVYAPIAVQVAGPDTICMGQEGVLLGSSTGGAGGNTYLWTGDATFVSGSDSTTAFTTNVGGLYELTVIDQCGNTGIGGTTVYAEACELEIPNIITPGSDGFNDALVIVNLDRFDNTIKIINRWGTVVFEQTNYKNDWYPSDLSDGTYFYIITLEDGRNYSGHLTIINE